MKSTTYVPEVLNLRDQEVQAKHTRNQRLGQQAKNGGHGVPAQGGLMQGLGRGLEKPAVRRIVCGAGGHKNGIYW